MSPREAIYLLIMLAPIILAMVAVHSNPQILNWFPMVAHSPIEPTSCAANEHMAFVVSPRFGPIGRHCVNN